MRSLLAPVLAVGCLCGMVGASVAAPAPKEGKTDKSGITPEKIRLALEQTGKFDFQAIPLAAVMKTIGEEYKIPIVVDKMVLAQMGFDTESVNVQVDLKDVKLKTALRTIVGEYNLTTAILSDCLLITTEEMAVYRQLKQRVSLDYEDVPLRDALKDISKHFGVNIVIDPKAIKSKAVDTKVSLQVDDVPVEAVVRLLCEMAELKPARMGNVILITTEARADKLKDSNSLVPAPTSPAMPGGGVFPFPGVPQLGGLGQAVPVPVAPVAPAVDLPAANPAPAVGTAPAVPPAFPPANLPPVAPEKKERELR